MKKKFEFDSEDYKPTKGDIVKRKGETKELLVSQINMEDFILAELESPYHVWNEPLENANQFELASSKPFNPRNIL